MLCIAAIVAVYYTHQYTLCIVVNVGCTHSGLATASIENLITLYRRTLHILMKDQLQPLLDIVTFDQERELLKPNS